MAGWLGVGDLEQDEVSEHSVVREEGVEC